MNNTISNEVLELIKEIKCLINVDDTTTEINPNYLQYFEQNELEDIKEQLLNRKFNQNKINKDYLDEIYEKIKE
jgi:hypothetical protein